MKLKFTNIIDLFLLPKDFYSRLTDKSIWLYIGIFFVGVRNIFFSLMGKGVEDNSFYDKIHIDARVVLVLLATVLVLGLLDVVSFSYPIFDIIKHFKRRKENVSAMSLGAAYSSFLTKVMKVYILANIVITPLDIIYNLTVYHGVSQQSAESITLMYNIASVLGILAYFWFNGVITRGLCVLFKIPNSVRSLVFVLAFFWNALLSAALGYLLDLVINRLF